MWTILTIAVTVFVVGYIAYKFPATWNWAVAKSAAGVNDAINAGKDVIKK
jgi:hypothetical protein